MHGFVPDQQVQSLAAFINGGSAGKRQGNAEAVIGKIKIEAAIGNIAVVCHARVIHILQKGGLIIVVAVHKSDELTLGQPQSGIARGGQTGVFLADRFKVRVFSHIFCDNFRAAVSGAVIYDDSLVILKGLIRHRLESLSQEHIHVINRDDNTDNRLLPLLTQCLNPPIHSVDTFYRK